MKALLAELQVAVFVPTAFSEIRASPMIVRLPHSALASRQTPEVGSSLVHVARSLVDVITIGLHFVPSAKIWPPRHTARLPCAAGLLAITVPGWIVRVAPGRTKIWVVR